MKKNLLIKIVTVITAITLLAGCSTSGAFISTPEVKEDTTGAVDSGDDGTGAVKEENQPQPVNQGITVNQIPFEIIDINTLSEEQISEIGALKVQRGYEFWQQEDGSFLILISTGEKMTGGYGIEVVSIEDNEGKTVIAVKESEPEGDMNLQAITYPFVVVQASGITDQFFIQDQNESEYTRMEAAEVPASDEGEDSGLFDTVLRLSEDFENPVSGIYQGQIDNHSIEVLVGEEYMTFSADDIARLLKGIEIGDKIEITRSISPSDQVTVESITKLQ